MEGKEGKTRRELEEEEQRSLKKRKDHRRRYCGRKDTCSSKVVDAVVENARRSSSCTRSDAEEEEGRIDSKLKIPRRPNELDGRWEEEPTRREILRRERVGSHSGNSEAGLQSKPGPTKEGRGGEGKEER